MIKNLLQVILGTLLIAGVSFAAQSLQGFNQTPNFEKISNQKQSPSAYFQVITATTTNQGIAKTFTHFFDTPYQEQGGCYRFKDKSGVGFTYLSVEDGVATFSQSSCE